MGDEDVDSTSTPSPADSPPPIRGFGMTVQKCQAIIQKSIKKRSDGQISNGEFGEIWLQHRKQIHKGRQLRSANVWWIREGGWNEVVQAVIHELIQAFDDCRAANIDWSNSAHQACSEIRANHLTGNCHYVREILRGHLKLDDLRIKGHEPVCVKRRSMQSVAAKHSPATAKRAVEGLWDTCYNDTAPFDRVP